MSPLSTGPGATIAGSVLPIRRAEELLLTLPGIMSAKIVASDTGAVAEIHLLTTSEFSPKQTVRNVESALIAHLGMRVDHRKISVAATTDAGKSAAKPESTGPLAASGAAGAGSSARAGGIGGGANALIPADVSAPRAVSVEPEVAARSSAPASAPSSGSLGGPTSVRERIVSSASEFRDLVREVDSALADVVPDDISRRRIYFEDVEVRRSRLRGVTCRVTLRKGDSSYTGEAEGLEGERARVDLAARAALKAIAQAERGERTLALDGVKLIDAFDREFVFVGVAAQVGRDRALLTGSCEVRESAEQASVLAALDATNRWIAHGR